MKGFAVIAAIWLVPALLAQTPCPPTPAYSPCEMVLELSPEEMQTHPDPYRTVTIDVEFRSPRFRTLRMPAFWDGGNRMVVRFSPTEPGNWDYRITGNLRRLDNVTGSFQATASNSPGFVRPRNVHHWGYTETDAPHLWMGATSLRFAFLDSASFSQLVGTRARQKFNHLRGLAIGEPEDSARIFPGGRPDPAWFRQLDERVAALNKAGIVVDLILGGRGNHLASLFPTAEARERYLRYMAGRYAAYHVTWEIVEQFEEYEAPRTLLRELGTALRRLDPYDHPRSTGAALTSSPLAQDGWMTHIVHNTNDSQIGAIEHQLYPLPFVNVAVGRDAGGQPAALRKQLWNASMNGQYPTFAAEAESLLDGPAGNTPAVWFSFFSQTRFWDLEPFFDVDGGRAVALEIPEDEEMKGVEYVIYLEKPGPVEAVVQKHAYDVAWFDPVTGERRKQRQFRGDRVRTSPPNTAQDWVLHVSRESEKERMLRRYKFESRRTPMQEVEQSAQRVPYEIVEPQEGTLPVEKPVRYAAKITRDTRATRSMMWVWIGEVSTEGQGFRVLGTGQEGQMVIPRKMASGPAAVLNLRLIGMNANGKVYFYDRIYRIAP